MATHRTVSFRIAPEKVDELDEFAKAMDRDRSYLLNEAIDGYLNYQRQFRAAVRKGIEEADQGKLIDHEVVMKRMESLIRERTREKRRKTA
jgi:predicted transcriptional regulator